MSKPIVFPEIKRFDQLFTESKAPIGNAPKIYTVKSWDAGTWSDPVSRNRSHLTGYCIVTGTNSYSLHVKPTKELAEWTKVNMLQCSNDSKYFEIVVRADGTALVTCSYGVIIGSYWLALIDAATVPQEIK